MTEERWLDVKAIVAMLGVHEQTVRRWIKEDGLPALMFGRRSGYRVRASDLEAFLQERFRAHAAAPGKNLAA